MTIVNTEFRRKEERENAEPLIGTLPGVYRVEMARERGYSVFDIYLTTG